MTEVQPGMVAAILALAIGYEVEGLKTFPSIAGTTCDIAV